MLVSTSKRKLLISQLLLFFNNYEPSKTKTLELLRSTDSGELARFVYLVEVTTKPKFVEYVNWENEKLFSINANAHQAYTISNELSNEHLMFNPCPKIRLTRCELDRTTTSEEPNFLKKQEDLDMTELLNSVKASTIFTTRPDIQRIFLNNLSSQLFGSFLKTLTSLFADNLKDDRNQKILQKDTITSKLIEYLSYLNYQTHNKTLRSFKNIMLPAHTLIHSKISTSSVVIQPRLQGFRIVLDSSNKTIRCFNRHGELIKGLLYNFALRYNCTFEAILLPIDQLGVVRSWRYWSGRAGFVLYIADVFRFENTMLTSMPFQVRIEYAAKFQNGTNLKTFPNNLSWDSLEELYSSNIDMFSPLTGVIIRHKDALPQTVTYEHKFNLTHCFDCLMNQNVSLTENPPPTTVGVDNFRFLFSLEMSEYKTVCIAYSHDEQNYYLCQFNRQFMDFEHSATMARSWTDTREPKYSKEPIFVLNSKQLAKGFLFLRVFFNKKPKEVVGYEVKPTTGKFDVPLKNSIYSSF